MTADLERFVTAQDGVFDTAMADTTSSWHLGGDGVWTRHSVGEDGKPLADLQERTMSLIQRRRRARAAR